MDPIHDSHNVMGMASILADDDNLDMNELQEIEQSIIKGLDLNIKKTDRTVDHVSDYKHDLEKLGKQFNTSNQFIDFETDHVEDKHEEEEEEDEIEIKGDFAPQSPIHISRSPEPSTHEEIRQRQIDQVLSKIDKTGETDQYLQEEDAEDEMARILEQIDLLRTNLEAEGVDLSRIQIINTNSSKKEAKAILKILQIKNDRMRYCDMFEEGIIACAYGLESVFDGKNVWFGKQIDLTGWSDTVKVKLRRMRYDTSQFVSETVKGYSIGSGWRILLELLPSLFLYSRDRKLRSNDSIATDAKYKDALRDLNK